MKIFTILFLAMSFYAYSQTFEWVNTVPLDIQTNPGYLHAPTVLDNDGNIISSRLVNFHELYSTAYYGDIELEKRNSDGVLMWADTLHNKVDISEIVVDGENNIICYGTFLDTLNIGTFRLFHYGQGNGYFLLKFDASGNVIWIKDGANYIDEYGAITALAEDGLNNILLGTSNYPIEVKILTLNSEANIISTIHETNVGTISDIKKDKSGNIWATGFCFNGQVSFNGKDTTAPFGYTEYLVKYDSGGTAKWINFIQDVTVQNYQIETDDSGNGYLAGNLLDSTSFGNLHAHPPQWLYDFFVTKITSDGNFVWLNQLPLGNPLGDAYIGNDNFLACRGDGYTFLTGTYRGHITFTDSITLTPLDYSDCFVLSYDPNGEIKWAKSAGSTSYDQASSVTVDRNGNCFLSGVVSQDFVFDTISGTGGYYNTYLAKLKFENIVTSVEGNKQNTHPDDFNLMQNYPNPFNPSTTIRYSVSTPGFVSLKLYDILGNEIAVLVNEYKAPGTYEIKFSAKGGSASGGNASKLASGVYFYRLQSGHSSMTKKMLLIQ